MPRRQPSRWALPIASRVLPQITLPRFPLLTLPRVSHSAGIVALAAACSHADSDPQAHQSVVQALAQAHAVQTQIAQAQIVNGREVAAGEFPGAAAIYQNGTFSCSGTLVHPEWVVTAAHCSPAPVRTTVGLGESRPDHVQLAVIEVFIHPDRNGARQDVALIKLAEPASATPTPIVVANFDATGQMATAWGFGRTGLNAPGSQQLLAVERTVPSYDECTDRLGAATQFDETMLCQFAAPFGESTCSGDSGGPLTVGSQAARQLAGVVQGGDNGQCGESPNGSVNFYGDLAHPTNHSFLTEHLPADAFFSDVNALPDASPLPADDGGLPPPPPDAAAPVDAAVAPNGDAGVSDSGTIAPVPSDAAVNPSDAGSSTNPSDGEIPMPTPAPTSSAGPVQPAPTPATTVAPVAPVGSAEPAPTTPVTTSGSSSGSGCSLHTASGSKPPPWAPWLVALGIVFKRRRW